MKTPAEIKAEYEQRKARIAELRSEIEVERIYIKALQPQCKHPNGYNHTVMGERSYSCPDCGYGW